MLRMLLREGVSEAEQRHPVANETYLSRSRMYALSESSSAGATEAGRSGVEAAGAGDSVRSRAFAFFFLADLDSTGAGGFWMSEAAMSEMY